MAAMKEVDEQTVDSVSQVMGIKNSQHINRINNQ